MLITDAAAPDNPIIEVNDAFTRLTGYSRDEVVGRNCRFLAGPGTEADARLELRRAIEQSRATVVELTNYRKDGTPFRNAVMIAPVRDRSGAAIFFVGSQMETGEGEGASGLRRSHARKLIEPLTPRLRQVLELMVGGYRNKEIAGMLSIHEKTVKMHRERLLVALGVKTSAEAVRLAVEADLIVSDPARPQSAR
jgi:PAS domain S-box-containing protein